MRPARYPLAVALIHVVVVVVATAGCGSDGETAAATGDGGAGSSGSSGTFGSSGGADGGVNAVDGCRAAITGTVRDFKGSDVAGGHPDFEAYKGRGETKALVAPDLGSDHKPVFASTTGNGGGNSQQLTGKADFDQWYRDTPNVNMPFEYAPPFVVGANGIATFASDAFFPIDGQGFGNSAKLKDGTEHNFSFTFELHMEFLYKGGEIFSFTGDDDLWTFINNKLAMDLGGLHPPASGTINLDDAAVQLGIEKGKTYPIDIFHAERAKFGSTFRIDTSLNFTNCKPIFYPGVK